MDTLEERFGNIELMTNRENSCGEPLRKNAQSPDPNDPLAFSLKAFRRSSLA
jgi:hypothetical protein